MKAASGISLPKVMSVIDSSGKIAAITLSSAEKVTLCLGLPPPPGGWVGPFGFYRLVSYLFGLAALLGIVMTFLATFSFRPDGEAAFASVLLTIAAFICAVAAYSHEALANQVTELATQNNSYASKNVALGQQVASLQNVSSRLQKCQTELNMRSEELQDCLRAFHKVTISMQLTNLVKAFTESDTDENGTLADSEIEAFFTFAGGSLQDAAPEFDFKALQQEAMKHGMGIHAMRLMINAVVAASDALPGKTSAMLALLMFSFDPVAHFDECLSALKIALSKNTEAELRAMLKEKQQDLLEDKAHDGLTSCAELLPLARLVMNSDPKDPAKDPDAVGKFPGGSFIAPAAPAVPKSTDRSTAAPTSPGMLSSMRVGLLSKFG